MKTYSFHPAIAADAVNPMTLDFSQKFEQQIQSFFAGCADLRGYESYGLPGQAVAAVLSLPVLEMSVGLPKTPVYDIGKREVVGELNLAKYRHEVVRPLRSELRDWGQRCHGYTILDGSGRGLTPDQFDELADQLGTRQIFTISVPLGQLDFGHPTKGVAEQLVKAFNSSHFASAEILYLPPGMGLGAVVQATAIYGLTEVWPKTIRLNRQADGAFHVEELVDPQALRQFGVGLEERWRKAEPTVTLSGNLPEGFEQQLRQLTDTFGVQVR